MKTRYIKVNRAFALHVIAAAAILALFPNVASAAALSVSIARTTVSIGDTFTAAVLVSSPDQALNAVSGELSFPNDLLAATAVSKAGSILTLWVQEPTYSNAGGTADWSGVAPNPGYTGLKGQIFYIQFHAKKAGLATISFTSSAVLANDGKGTNILTSAAPDTVTITEAVPAAPVLPPPNFRPAITSTTHPDQNTTYSATHVVLDWTNGAGATAVRIGYNKYPDRRGVVVYRPAISHKEIDLDPGTWYFHAQDKIGGQWGPFATFAVHIGTSSVTTTMQTTAPTLASTSAVAPDSVSISASNSPRMLASPFIMAVLITSSSLAGIFLGLFIGSRARRHMRAVLAAHQAHAVLRRHFEDLKDAILEEITALEKVRSRRSLTTEEERLINRLSRLLDRAEHEIEQELFGKGN